MESVQTAQFFLDYLEGIQLIFGGSGIVPAALVAIILNIALPKED